jgi:enoyl-CoA hydratase
MSNRSFVSKADLMPATPPEFDALHLVIDGQVAEITLCRPEHMNSFDDTLHHEFVQVLRYVRERDDVRAIVLASKGKVFSAGGDFELVRAGHDDSRVSSRIGQGLEFFSTLIDTPIPIVVALHGHAIGIGATAALACDAVVAFRGARLSDPHVTVGLAAGDGGCVVWPQSVGMLRARRHLLTGDPVTAEDGYAMGLVTDLVDTPDEVLPAARALAARIAALPPLAVQGTKRALNRLMHQRADEVLELSMTYEVHSLRSEDLLEALSAFQERRPGDYRGR